MGAHRPASCGDHGLSVEPADAAGALGGLLTRSPQASTVRSLLLCRTSSRRNWYACNKSEMQIKIQGRFCYLESQLCCYIVTFLEPRFIFCKQFIGLLPHNCRRSQTTDYHLVFRMCKTADHRQNLLAEIVEKLLSLYKMELLKSGNTTAIAIALFYWVIFRLCTLSSFYDSDKTV